MLPAHIAGLPLEEALLSALPMLGVALTWVSVRAAGALDSVSGRHQSDSKS